MTEISKPLVSLISPPSSEQSKATTKLPQPALPKVQADTIPGLNSDLLQKGSAPPSAPSAELATTAKPSAPTRVSAPPLEQSQKQAPALTVAHKLLELYGEAELAADVRASRLSGNPDDRRDALNFLQEKLGVDPGAQTGRLNRNTKEAILGGLSSYIRGGENVSEEVREDFRLLDIEVNPPAAGPTHDNLDAIRDGFVKERGEKIKEYFESLSMPGETLTTIGASTKSPAVAQIIEDNAMYGDIVKDIQTRLFEGKAQEQIEDFQNQLRGLLGSGQKISTIGMRELLFPEVQDPNELADKVEDLVLMLRSINPVAAEKFKGQLEEVSTKSVFLKPTPPTSADVFMQADEATPIEEVFLPVGSDRPEPPGAEVFLPPTNKKG